MASEKRMKAELLALRMTRRPGNQRERQGHVSHYDDCVYSSKREVTRLICSLVSEDERKHRFAVEQMPGAIDNLNKDWDELTSALVRQREERDHVIQSLINQLAEAKKPR